MCESEIALAWAVNATNALQNFGDFTPNQLVFGHNVITPSTLMNDLPGFESTIKSEIIRSPSQNICR